MRTVVEILIQALDDIDAVCDEVTESTSSYGRQIAVQRLSAKIAEVKKAHDVFHNSNGNSRYYYDTLIECGYSDRIATAERIVSKAPEDTNSGGSADLKTEIRDYLDQELTKLAEMKVTHDRSTDSVVRLQCNTVISISSVAGGRLANMIGDNERAASFKSYADMIMVMNNAVYHFGARYN